MKAFLLVLKREALLSLHDPRRLVFLFGAAVAYLLVFGLLYIPNIVTDVPCVVLDQENSHLSRQLLTALESSDSLCITDYVTSEEEMREALREKRAYAAIEIPQDFSKKVKTGRSSDVLYMANGANIILTNITSSAVADILADFSNRLAVERVALRTGAEVETVQHVISPVTPHLRVLHNMTQGYMFFFLLGLAMVAFQQGIFFAVGASITDEFEALAAGAEDAAAHMSPWLLLVVKVVYFWGLSMMSYLLVVFLVQNLMGIPLHAPLQELLLLASTFIFAAMSFVVLFAACFHREMQFVRGIIMYPVVAFIFSGYTWPHESMPVIMQYAANAFPLSFFSNTVRELFLAGYSPHLWHDIGALLIIALICLPLGGWIFAYKVRRYRQQAAQLHET